MAAAQTSKLSIHPLTPERWADFERLFDFLLRRAEFEAAPRARLAQRLAAALAVRAGLEPPPPGEAESFLEALHAFASEEP